MTIKGSLLRSVPIVKRFGRKLLSKMGQKFEVLGVYDGKMFNPNNETP